MPIQRNNRRYNNNVNPWWKKLHGGWYNPMPIQRNNRRYNNNVNPWIWAPGPPNYNVLPPVPEPPVPEPPVPGPPVPGPPVPGPPVPGPPVPNKVGPNKPQPNKPPNKVVTEQAAQRLWERVYGVPYKPGMTMRNIALLHERKVVAAAKDDAAKQRLKDALRNARQNTRLQAQASRPAWEQVYGVTYKPGMTLRDVELIHQRKVLAAKDKTTKQQLRNALQSARRNTRLVPARQAVASEWRRVLGYADGDSLDAIRKKFGEKQRAAKTKEERKALERAWDAARKELADWKVILRYKEGMTLASLRPRYDALNDAIAKIPDAAERQKQLAVLRDQWKLADQYIASRDTNRSIKAFLAAQAYKPPVGAATSNSILNARAAGKLNSGVARASTGPADWRTNLAYKPEQTVQNVQKTYLAKLKEAKARRNSAAQAKLTAAFQQAKRELSGASWRALLAYRPRQTVQNVEKTYLAKMEQAKQNSAAQAKLTAAFQQAKLDLGKQPPGARARDTNRSIKAFLAAHRPAGAATSNSILNARAAGKLNSGVARASTGPADWRTNLAYKPEQTVQNVQKTYLAKLKEAKARRNSAAQAKLTAAFQQAKRELSGASWRALLAYRPRQTVQNVEKTYLAKMEQAKQNSAAQAKLTAAFQQAKLDLGKPPGALSPARRRVAQRIALQKRLEATQQQRNATRQVTTGKPPGALSRLPARPKNPWRGVAQRIAVQKRLEATQQQRQTLPKNKWRLINVDGDGTCMFQAIVVAWYKAMNLGLPTDQNRKKAGDELRGAVVRHVLANPRLYEKELFDVTGVNGKMVSLNGVKDKVQRYVNAMQQRGCYGDDVALRAAARVLNMRIMVYALQNNTYVLRADEPPGGYRPLIGRLLLDKKHYQAIVAPRVLKAPRTGALEYFVRALSPRQARLRTGKPAPRVTPQNEAALPPPDWLFSRNTVMNRLARWQLQQQRLLAQQQRNATTQNKAALPPPSGNFLAAQQQRNAAALPAQQRNATNPTPRQQSQTNARNYPPAQQRNATKVKQRIVTGQKLYEAVRIADELRRQNSGLYVGPVLNLTKSQTNARNNPTSQVKQATQQIVTGQKRKLNNHEAVRIAGGWRRRLRPKGSDQRRYHRVVFG